MANVCSRILFCSFFKKKILPLFMGGGQYLCFSAYGIRRYYPLFVLSFLHVRYQTQTVFVLLSAYGMRRYYPPFVLSFLRVNVRYQTETQVIRPSGSHLSPLGDLSSPIVLFHTQEFEKSLLKGKVEGVYTHVHMLI